MKRNTLTYCLLMLSVNITVCLSAAGLPAVEVVTQKYAARPDEYFPVEYRVSWPGDAGAYTVLPPTLPALDWGEAKLLEMRSRRQGDQNEACVLVGYRAETSGQYDAPALDIHVIEWTEKQNPVVNVVASEMPTQVLTAPAVTVVIQSSTWAVGILGALIFAVLLAAVGILYRRRRKASIPANQERSPEEQLRSLLHEARRCRLDGDYYAFYRALRQACDLAARISDQPGESLCVRLDQRIKDTGYRGLRPSEDDLEGDFKDVEQLAALTSQRGLKET